MKTSILAIAAGLAAGGAVAQDGSGSGGDLPQAGNEWFTQGQETLQQKMQVETNTNTARNVILMISDGNGVGSNYMTRLYMGQQEGGMGDDHVLPFETFPHLALSKTYNTNAQTPDSAGTGTAMQSGIKTKAGMIGVNASLNRGECGGVMENSVASIAEILAEAGKEVGLVSTARITHATPASAYAKTTDRNFEDETPEGCDFPDIASQLLEKMGDGTVDVAMGGGRRHFVPEGTMDEEGQEGRRTDDRDLRQEAKDAGAQYAWNQETFESADLDQTPILGLFEDSHMMYEYDRADEPSLAEMTRAAIEALQGSENGFYLMVEAGRVDHANHAGNAFRMVTDGAAFAEAVAAADEMTDDEETLIVVTADHEHSIGLNGYCGRGSPILGLCYEINEEGTEYLADEPVLGTDGLPFTVIGYLNGPGSVLTPVEEETSDAEAGQGQQQTGTAGDAGGEGDSEETPRYAGSRPEITNEEAQDPEYLQQALIPKDSESHSAEDVAIYAKGPFAHLLNGTVEQNFIFHVMHHAAMNGQMAEGGGDAGAMPASADGEESGETTAN